VHNPPAITPFSELRDWRPRVDDLTDVQKLVHLAARMDEYDIDAIRTDLLRARRQAFEDELRIQAARVGCPNRSAHLANGPILHAIAEESERDAAGIANTYNYELAGQLEAIRQDTPRANRHVYARRVSAWADKRNVDKSSVIAQWTEGTARARALSEFVTHNGGFGSARLEPLTAVCPVCEGWIRRGEVPLRTAANNPPPYHPRCPHVWATSPDKVAKEECPLLWMGA
jgi:hypothetical protein